MSNRQVQTSLISLNKTDLAADARKHDPAALEILAHDMKEQGQLQEIIVESKGGRFIVIAGVGRTLAARKLGWKEIRASVRENVSDYERARMTFAENEDREDADPFYQASMIQKMLKANKITQTALAKDLGVSEGLVSAYVSVNELPKEIRQKFRRLNLGQLTQITRLNNAVSKIEFAANCEKNDLSVRQMKSLVDRALRKKAAKPVRRSAPPPLPDPLSKTWEKIKDDVNFASNIYWEVHYGTHKLDIGRKVNGWFFFIMPEEGYSQKGLSRWFRQMSQVLEGKPVKEELPDSIQESVAMSSEFMKVMQPRVPKNAQEEKELANIALRGGPRDVYSWIYGKDHAMTRSLPVSTWKEINTPPLQGLKDILDGIKQLT